MATTDLIEQALDNLVNQFANPMDFLRELVQNSIDAGSARIEVEVRFQVSDPPHGVAEIEVRDFGQGMDEDVIDSQLTKLFSSAKEGDRTAIGKFGIGFTSVFAIRPDAVRVVTGKHGENWEIVFHSDRSFEKRRYDGVASGTTITSYKRLRQGKVAELVDNARASLVHWCEHAHTPLQFIDATTTDPTEVAKPDAADPFAAFETGEVGERINTPFGLADAHLQIAYEDQGIRVAIGFADTRSWSFFSGGLTLLRSHDPSHLGPYEAAFRGLSFKILSPHVGHTLTRDNVIQDDNWHTAMRVAEKAATKLRETVLDEMERLAAAGELAALQQWHIRLQPDLGRQPLDPARKVFLDPALRPCSLGALQSRLGVSDEVWQVDPADERLAAALAAADVSAVVAHPGTADLLHIALDHEVLDAASAFCVCQPLEPDEQAPAVATLIHHANELAGRATLTAVSVGLCDLGAHSPLLFVEGHGIEGLYRVPESGGLQGLARRQLKRWQTWIGRRTLLVNRSHPHVEHLAQTSDPQLAALALVEALIVAEAGFPRATLNTLRSTAVRRWIDHGS